MFTKAMAQELTRTQSFIDFKNGYCSEDNDILEEVRDAIYQATQKSLSSTKIVMHSCESHVVDTTLRNSTWIYCPKELLQDCIFDLQLLLKEYGYVLSTHPRSGEIKIHWDV